MKDDEEEKIIYLTEGFTMMVKSCLPLTVILIMVIMWFLREIGFFDKL